MQSITLEGKLVRLVPLSNMHFSDLLEIGSDARIWENLPIDGNDRTKLNTELRNALMQKANGTQYPFAIVDKHSGKVIGSTRFLELYLHHKKLEIGWTWYTPEVWGKGHNLDCKLILLTYCFDVLQLNRVQLKTRDTNKRSQAAIQKIGGVFEGILRKDRVMPDGAVRDTVMFSIIRDEWPETRAMLGEKLEALL